MRTEIATLGEFGLIRHLTEGIELKNESSRYGVGDDAAVLSYPAEKEVLVTTDLLMEGVHFDLVYVPLKHLGYKSAVVNFSDIYERHTEADYRFLGHIQAFQYRRHGGTLCRHPFGLRRI